MLESIGEINLPSGSYWHSLVIIHKHLGNVTLEEHQSAFEVTRLKTKYEQKAETIPLSTPELRHTTFTRFGVLPVKAFSIEGQSKGGKKANYFDSLAKLN